MDNYQAEIIDRFSSRLKTFETFIELSGTYGSLKKDIDIIIVLHPESKCHRSGFSILKAIDENISELKNEFRTKTNILISPSFKHQVWVKALSTRQRAKEKVHSNSVHLLVYPDFDRLVQWEPALFPLTMIKSINPIMGSKHRIEEEIKNLSIPPLHERLEYYNSLLFEYYQLFKLSGVNKALLLPEIASKMEYILKFSSLEFLYTYDFLPEEYYNLQILENRLEKFDLPELTVFKSFMEPVTANTVQRNMDELFDKLNVYIPGLSAYKKDEALT